MLLYTPRLPVSLLGTALSKGERESERARSFIDNLEVTEGR
jgi:hypothetical protein